MNYILDIKNKKYNLGCVPNRIIDYYIHNLNLQEVLFEYKITLKEKIIQKFDNIYKSIIIKIDNIYDNHYKNIKYILKDIQDIENLEEDLIHILYEILLNLIETEKFQELESKRWIIHRKLNHLWWWIN